MSRLPPHARLAALSSDDRRRGGLVGSGPGRAHHVCCHEASQGADRLEVHPERCGLVGVLGGGLQGTATVLVAGDAAQHSLHGGPVDSLGDAQHGVAVLNGQTVGADLGVVPLVVGVGLDLRGLAELVVHMGVVRRQLTLGEQFVVDEREVCGHRAIVRRSLDDRHLHPGGQHARHGGTAELDDVRESHEASS